MPSLLIFSFRFSDIFLHSWYLIMKPFCGYLSLNWLHMLIQKDSYGKSVSMQQVLVFVLLWNKLRGQYPLFFSKNYFCLFVLTPTFAIINNNNNYNGSPFLYTSTYYHSIIAYVNFMVIVIWSLRPAFAARSHMSTDCEYWNTQCEIWRSYSSADEYCILLRCHASWTGKELPLVWKNVIPAYSGPEWRWRHFAFWNISDCWPGDPPLRLRGL